MSAHQYCILGTECLPGKDLFVGDFLFDLAEEVDGFYGG
jgi:hypothetical protein